MNKEKLLKSGKILIILFLVLAIALLAFLQWKKDLILRTVIDNVQQKMEDSIRYSEATLNWFSYFPSVAIELRELSIGNETHPLVRGGDIQILLRLFPLFRDELVINRVRISDAHIDLVQKNGKWSYDVFRNGSQPPAGKAGKDFSTLIRRIDLDNTRLVYDDGNSLHLTLFFESCTVEGGLSDPKLDAALSCKGTLEHLKIPSYTLPSPLHLTLDGHYVYDRKTGLQMLQSWELVHDAVALTVDGSVQDDAGQSQVDLTLEWKDGQPELLKTWLPSKLQQSWKAFILSGTTEGRMTIEGKSSPASSPRILSSANWKDGGIDFITGEDDLKDLEAAFTYDSGDPLTKTKSSLRVEMKKGGLLGKSLDGDIRIQNLDQPVIDVTLNGRLPASLMNLFSMQGLEAERGYFDIKKLDVRDLSLSGSGLLSVIRNSDAEVEIRDVSLRLFGHPTAVSEGTITVSSNRLSLEASDLIWSEAKAKDVRGTFDADSDALGYTIHGKMCGGEMDITGEIRRMSASPVMESRWIVKSVEMRDLMASFSNFDQTFITSDHLSGKANIWAESVIPFNEKWQILTGDVFVRSAVEIHDGRLKNMKTLEDFSKYVHLEDLQDIRFSQLRNYLKIEGGKVYLPVMFIQSSAINLSISGVHGFDQRILYNVKVNAGQTAAHKLKKSDVRKELKQARKSGWINMYFVLEGTTSDVRYQQYRTAVISGFEQSARLKEDLRKYLVDTFGYDLYWVEPNEWEDIPEYR